MKNFRYLKDVATLKLDSEKCIGCGNCLNVCPHSVLGMENKKAYIDDFNACIECGACSTNCPAEALQVKPGVGCAAYIIQQWTGGKAGGCC